MPNRLPKILSDEGVLLVAGIALMIFVAATFAATFTKVSGLAAVLTAGSTPELQPTFFAGFMTPEHLLLIGLGLLDALVLAALIFISLGELKSHHLKMSFYGLSLIIFMLGLAYTFSAFVLTSTL